jgi:hypothetical protein
MNTAYRDLLVARAASAVAEAQALASVQHSGLKGQLREVVVRNLLRPLLPIELGIGRGEVISSYDQHSSECDVIVYRNSIVPSLLLDRTAGIFPLEAVLFTIEVKSTLNNVELNKTHAAAKKMSTLLHRPGSGEPGTTPPEHVIPCLLAFKSDLDQGQTTEIDRYKKLCGKEEPAIRALCVVDRGYWYYANGQWNEYGKHYRYAELMGLIDGIHQSHERVAKSRSKPTISDYLVSPNQ